MYISLKYAFLKLHQKVHVLNIFNVSISILCFKYNHFKARKGEKVKLKEERLGAIHSCSLTVSAD